MRQTGICTKCQHNQLLHVGEIPDQSDVRDSSLHVTSMFTGHGFFGNEKRRDAGRLSAVVCRACGYTELSVLDPAAIKPDGKYVTELSGPQRTAPFR